MKKSKKILALLLSIVMLATVVPLTVFAKVSPDGLYDYMSMGHDGLMITRYRGSERDVIIPSKIGNSVPSELSNVTRIGKTAFQSLSTVETVTIPATVTEIDERAFSGCSSLTAINVAEDNTKYCSVDGVLFNKDKTSLIEYPEAKDTKSYKIPETVTEVSNYAFDNCSKIENISMPSSITAIGICAFSGCTALIDVLIPDGVKTIGDYAFSGCTSFKKIAIPDSVTNIEAHVFANCTLLESVAIPDSVTSIGYYAFYDCASLKSVTIPDSVTSIEDSAFNGCTSLKSVTIGNSVVSIGDWAFSGCSLTSVNIPDSVTSIGRYVFSNCTSLREINVSADNTSYMSVDGVLFNKDKTELICYPAGKTEKSYHIPDGVTSIEGYAFNGCTSLKSITIGNSVSMIDRLTFSNCTSLESIIIPDSVTNIVWSAFSGCTSLKSVEIGKGVTAIESEAFVDCNSLKSVTIPKNVTVIGQFAFGYTYKKPAILKLFGIETHGGGDYPEYKIPNFTIYGVKGTAAEKYANDNDFKFIEITETIPGDLDGDSTVTASDAIVIQRHIVGLETLGTDRLKNADLNGDGIVDEGDAIAILRIDAGLAS